MSVEDVTEDDFFDESSIEALNWSEADEEELAIQQQRQQKSKLKSFSPKKKVEKKGDKSSSNNKENVSVEGMDYSEIFMKFNKN